MAKVVLGVATSHSPLLALDGEEWTSRAAEDLRSKELNLSDGRFVSYDVLKAEVGEPYADVANAETFVRKANAAQDALTRLADDIERADPDVILVIGDDQEELYSAKNMPAVAVYYGAEMVTHTHSILSIPSPPVWAEKVTKGWAVDAVHRFPADERFALDLIAGLLDNNVDISACGEILDPDRAGFGHAFGFVCKRLMRKPIPMVPILLNTYFEPNVISAARAIEVGRAIKRTIDAMPSDTKVAVLASGGLSHFVVDEELDRKVIRGMVAKDAATLGGIPRRALNSGSSEILNWIMLYGVIEDLTPGWDEYIPVQRTPAGTGIGLGFATWV